MVLGISSYTYPWAIGIPGYMPGNPMTETGLIRKAMELSVGLVQLADNLPLHEMSQDRLDRLISEAAGNGTQLETGARGMTEEHLHHYILLAEKIGSPLLRFVIDDKNNFKPGSDEIISIIKNALNDLSSRNIILALENYERMKTGEFVHIIRKLDSEFAGICLDTINSLGALEGTETVVERLAPYTVNLHIKDARIYRPAHKLGYLVEGTPAGEGMLPLPWILERLGTRCRSAVLEQWVPPEEKPGETILKEETWARKSIKNLRIYFT
jgi:sugar phosphate isomerase/epimerase